MKIKRRIYGAAEDMDFGADRFGDPDGDVSEDVEDMSEDSLRNEIDNISDDIDDLKDMIEDEVIPDSSSISINNNITDHYIAECEQCQGIFISAVVKSDQNVDCISGVCPLCNKETSQYLKWVVTAI